MTDGMILTPPSIMVVMDRSSMIEMLERYIDLLEADNDHAVVALMIFADRHEVRAYTEEEWDALRRTGERYY